MRVPGTLDLYLYRYAGFRLETVFKDANGDPINVTGYKGLLECRPEPDSDIRIFRWTSDTGQQISFGTTNGLITISLTAAQVIAGDYPVGNYFYDFYVQDAAGMLYPHLTGSFAVRNSNIRSAIDW